MIGANETTSNHADPRYLLGVRTLELLAIPDISSIEVINTWHQGGGESYVADFLLTKADVTRHLLAKACIKFGPREAMAEWLSRRSILQTCGVSTPELIVVDGATIVEEFIPHSLREAYAQADDENREMLKSTFIDTCQRIHSAGFRPKSLHDVRSRGSDVVVIDYGEDLGSANSNSTEQGFSQLDAEKHLRGLV